MSARRQALWERRMTLLQRSADLRDQLTQHSVGLVVVLGVADRACAAGRWVRAHPCVPVLAGLALWVLKPAFVWRWTTRGWAVWRLVQRTREKVPAGLWQGVMAVFRR